MSMTDEQLQYQRRSAQLYQAKYDEVLRKVGQRAPQPIMGQSPDDYRRESLRVFKKTFLSQHPLYKLNMRGLEGNVLNNFEPQVLDAVVTEAYNPNNVPLGELRKIEELDPYGQVRQIKFIGQESFVKQMGTPGRRVVSFTTDRGRWDAFKAKWF